MLRSAAGTHASVGAVETLAPARPQRNLLPLATPNLVCDLDVVRARYAELKAALRGAACHYAVKCNPSPSIVRCLAAEGSRFEVASFAELALLVDNGVPAGDVLFGNPVKPPADIERAYALGVRRFVFDSEAEARKIARLAPGAEVLVRIAVDNSDSFFPLSGKFGAAPASAGLLSAEAQAAGLKAVGISFHVGSQCTRPDAWRRAIAVAGGVMADAAARGVELSVLDIGGGLPARYTSPVPSIREIGAAVGAAVKDLPGRLDELIVEPGRFLVADSSVLTTTVIGRASRDGTEWVYTDAGVFNGLMEASQGNGRWTYPMWTSRPDHFTADRALFTVAGPTCDSADTMFYDLELPAAIDVGDRLFIACAGAYTLSYASHFNGFAPPVAAFVDGPTVAVEGDASVTGSSTVRYQDRLVPIAS